MGGTTNPGTSIESRAKKFRGELTRLYQVDYGAPIELLARTGGTLLAGAFISDYTGWAFVWFWVASFFILQTSHFLFLSISLKRPEVGIFHLVIAQSIFLSILGVFVSVPALMMASQDDALAMAGFCIFGSVLVFLVRRSENSMALAFSELAVFSIVTCLGVAIVWSRQSDEVASRGLVFAAGFFLFYLAHNAYLIRRERVVVDELSERLVQSQKMEAIGKLAGGVAHDFNNSLTAVTGNLDLIDETNDPILKQEFLDNARQSARHSAALVSQLLIYAGKYDSESICIRAKDLLHDVERMSNALIPAQVEVNVDKPEGNYEVNVDQSQLTAAVLNLVKNSAEAMGNSGQIQVSAKRQMFRKEVVCLAGQILPRAEYVILTVSDNGLGIAGDIFNHVTEPFFTTKPIGKGTGMGLSMVAGFASRSEGGLRIASSPKGTAVEILLPLAEKRTSS